MIIEPVSNEFIDTYFRNIGWQVVQVAQRGEGAQREEGAPALSGLIGERILVKNVESGEEYQSTLIDTSDDEIAGAICKNIEQIVGLKTSDVIAPLKMGWITPTLFYCISTMVPDDAPLAMLPREVYAHDGKQACRTLIALITSVESLIDKHLCHLAISPWSLYKNQKFTRLGELWFCRYGKGSGTRTEMMTIRAIPHAVQHFCAPEVVAQLVPSRGAESARIDVSQQTGTHSDVYSLTLMALFLVAGYNPDRSIEDSSNRTKAIRAACPLFDKEVAEALALGLEPNIDKRLTMYQFRYAIGRLASQLGVDYLWSRVR